MVKTESSPSRLKVGDRIKFMMGDAETEATVIEDRGNLGVGGRQIVRIRTEAESADAMDRASEAFSQDRG